MQFELRTLIEFVTSCSICLALIVPNPVAALSLSTLLMLTFALLRYRRQGKTGVGHMTAFGAMTSFGWMMFFGFGTIIVHCLYCTFIGEWPPIETQYIDLPTGIVLFILIYGIPSLLSGACIGWLVALVIEFATRNPAENA